jgi:hypothetical protein
MLKKTPLKRGNKPLAKSSLKKSGKAKHIDRQEQREEDIKFYTEIWNERNKRCELTGKYLGEEIMIIYFHHLLPKNKYPEFRHKKWNIIQIQSDLHAQIEINENKLTENIFDKYKEFEYKAKKRAGLI